MRGSVEHHDAAGDLSGSQRLEAVVDLIELVGAADELVELEPAVEVELDETREVDRRPHRAVHAALERLLLEDDRIGRDRSADRHGRHPDDDGDAALAYGVENLERGLLAPDGVDGR